MAQSISTTTLNFDGFRPEIIDKVRHLLVILDRISAHPYLKNRICLHGGTALNLFLLSTPRLSVDIDLNYVGSTDRDVMYAERAKLEQSIVDIGRELGLEVRSGSEEHSGRSLKLNYQGGFGADHVKIDIDYLNRSPLLPPVAHTITTNDNSTITFPLNAAIEIIGGKVKALLSRVTPRDLYDICQISEYYPTVIDSDNELLLRRILLYYSVLSDPFPKPFTIAERFAGRSRDVEDILYPTLLAGDRPMLENMIETASTFINSVTRALDTEEYAFLKSASEGHFMPELLFEEHPEVLLAALKDPSALWKMQNIRKMDRQRER